MSEDRSTRAGNWETKDEPEKQRNDADRVLLTDGGDPKVVGELPDDGGTGVLGKATGSGTTYGVRGEASSGYGLGTPHDLLLKGVLDTDEGDFVVEAGTTNTNRAQNIVMGHAGNSATNTYGATISGGGEDDGSDPVLLHEVTEGYGTIGGGRNNTVDGFLGTVGGGGNNTANGRATVGGGNNNVAAGEESTIAGGQANTASGNVATVGGGERNDARAEYATIAGGGPTDSENPSTTNNVVFDNYGTIGGGGNNQAGSDNSDSTDATYATVGGGQLNEASGNNATVGGGWLNAASGNNATVAGGTSNKATGARATVGGGGVNRASGTRATVPGGGFGAAESPNSFVWNDNSEYHSLPNVSRDGLSSDKTVASDDSDPTGSNTFSVSATGGVRFITGSDQVTYLTDASTGWTSASSRAVKTNIDPVDPGEALAGVEQLEVATWEYENDDGEGAGTTHIGPMAEEFHDAFDVGDSDKHINSINADGAAFAAIQGLSEKLDEKTEQIEEQQDRIEHQAARIEALEEQNRKLEERLTALESQSTAGGPIGADD